MNCSVILTREKGKAANKLSCTSRIKKPYKDLAGSVASTREFIAKYTVGKIHPAVFFVLTAILLGIHIFIFVIGTSQATECSGRPLVPVYLVLLGGGGMLKCLSFLLQLAIVWQVGMETSNAVSFMSETSVLDNGLNWIYILFLILGLFGTFYGGQPTDCVTLVYDTSRYVTIIIVTIVAALIVLDIGVLIYRKCMKKKVDNHDDEFELVEQPHS